MSNETKKCYHRRMIQNHLSKLIGNGIDIGPGNDCFIPSEGNCIRWDKKDGNNGLIFDDIYNNYFDYLYSSHCLEHIKDYDKAINKWIDIVKVGGYLYIVVPDFNLYEGGLSISNPFHKVAFSINKKSDPNIPLVNIMELFYLKLYHRVEILYISLCDQNYNYKIGTKEDQTRKNDVLAHIEIMLKKIS
jgi:ubiquinone/menaquinone biosynthesis C-methylase UbiE